MTSKLAQKAVRQHVSPARCSYHCSAHARAQGSFHIIRAPAKWFCSPYPRLRNTYNFEQYISWLYHWAWNTLHRRRRILTQKYVSINVHMHGAGNSPASALSNVCPTSANLLSASGMLQFLKPLGPQSGNNNKSFLEKMFV